MRYSVVARASDSLEFQRGRYATQEAAQARADVIAADPPDTRVYRVDVVDLWVGDGGITPLDPASELPSQVVYSKLV